MVKTKNNKKIIMLALGSVTIVIIAAAAMVLYLVYFGAHGPYSGYDDINNKSFGQNEKIYKGKTYSQLCADYARKYDIPIEYKCTVTKYSSIFTGKKALMISYKPVEKRMIVDVRIVDIKIETGKESYAVSN